jgi:hypothetical protein
MIDAREIAGHATSLRGEEVDVNKSRELKPRTNLDTPALDVRFQAARSGAETVELSGHRTSKKRSGFDPNAKLTPRLWRELSSALLR